MNILSFLLGFIFKIVDVKMRFNQALEKCIKGTLLSYQVDDEEEFICSFDGSFLPSKSC